MEVKKFSVSLNNGCTYKTVEQLTDDEIARVLEDINTSDAERVTDAINNTSADTDREWLEKFLINIGDNWIIG